MRLRTETSPFWGPLQELSSCLRVEVSIRCNNIHDNLPESELSESESSELDEDEARKWVGIVSGTETLDDRAHRKILPSSHS